MSKRRSGRGRSRANRERSGRTPEDADAPRPTATKDTGRTYRGLTLNPFQVEAVDAIAAGHSVLLSAPTGAGKTLVAEYAIEETLNNGRRAIYTAPIKALSSQKYRDFKEYLDVGLMTGDVTINPEAPLLVMTTEIFRNTIFESPRQLDDVDYVVFDEIHYMDDPERGTVWEESIIFAPSHIRLISLSATVSNLQQFGDWIEAARGTPLKVIKHTERPVPLRHYLFFPGYGSMRADKLKRFPHVPKRRKTRGAKNNVLDFLQHQGSMPILFFCFSRKECERRARNAYDRGLLDGREQKRMQKHFDDIQEMFQIPEDSALDELRVLAMQGISYHHAGLLPLHKELVERLFTSGLLKLLFTTETFALGINMPARAVVFASLRKFDGVGFDFIKAREYQQMAGRAGRQGIDKEGLCYSIIDDPRIRNPSDVTRVLYGQIESIRSRFNLSYSTLINLHRVLGDRIFDAWDRSFNNYQWARMPRRKREKNERKQMEAIDSRLGLLHELEYIEHESGVTDKGQVAAVINGFELPVAELYFSGLLEWLDEYQLLIVTAALVFEERRGDIFTRLDKRILGEHKGDVERIMGRLIAAERRHVRETTIREANFKVGAVVHAFAKGAELDELGDLSNASPGDMVRVFRLTVQVLRQLRKAVRRDREFGERIAAAIELINRDAVDAKRQLELG